MFKFVGGLKSLTRNFLSDFIKNNFDDSAEVVNLASGKFTAEKIFLECGVKKIYSNDISFLSVLIGKYLSCKDFSFKFKGEFEFLNSKLKKDLAHNIGCVITAMDMLEYTGSGVIRRSKKKLIKNNIDFYIQKNTENFIKEYEPLKGKIIFIGKDLNELIKDDNFCKNKIIFAFIPTYEGGYEKLYKNIEKNIEWDRIEYSIISDYEKINTDVLKNENAIIVTDRELLGIDKDLLCAKIMDNGHPSFIYTNLKNNKIAFIEKETKQYKLRGIITEKEVFEINKNSNIEILKTRGGILSTIKSDKLGNKNISKGADCYFVFSIDKKIIGFFSVKRYTSDYFLILQDYVYCNARRLSKLLIMLISTKEVRNLIIKQDCFFACDEKNLEIDTCVFTDKPVSMKYRGVCELTNRLKGRLVYRFNFEKTIKEQFLKWLEKN